MEFEMSGDAGDADETNRRKPTFGELLGSFQINDCLLKLIHQFLLYNDFENTANSLVHEAPKLGFDVLAEHLCASSVIPREICDAIIKEYVEGDAEQFFRLWNTSIPKNIRDTVEHKILTFKLQVHFAILPLRMKRTEEKWNITESDCFSRSLTKKVLQNAAKKYCHSTEQNGNSKTIEAMDQLRAYLETEGREFEERTELLPLFALPCLDEAHTYGTFPEIFDTNWLNDLTRSLQIYLMNRKQINSTECQEVSTETMTIDNSDSFEKSVFIKDEVGPSVDKSFELVDRSSNLPLEINTKTIMSLIPRQTEHHLLIVPNDRDVPMFRENLDREERMYRCPTRRSRQIHSKSAQTRITTVATMTNYVSIGDLRQPATILNFSSYMENQKNSVQSSQELTLANAHLYNIRINYKKLKIRFHELHSDYHKLIGIASELTSALENSVRGQAVNLQSMLESCVKIFPDLFRRNIRDEDNSPTKPAIDTTGESMDLNWQENPPLTLDISPLSAKLLDYKKIKLHLMNGSVKTKLLLLQALRWKLTLSQPADRDETINEYLKGDLLGLHAQVACDGGKTILQYLLIPKDASTPHPLQQSTARLLNTLASLRCGRDYLSVGATLLNLIVRCLNGNNADCLDAFTCDMIIATLQKISLRKQQRLYMIEIGLVEWVICHLKAESHRIGSYRLEYASALLMNLSLHKEAQTRAAAIAPSLISTLTSMLATDHAPALPYVNGALNNFLSNQIVNEEAKRSGLASVLEYHRQRHSGEIRKHFEHILRIHNRNYADDTDDYETADDDNEELDVLEDELEEADPVKVHTGELSGEALLATFYSIKSYTQQYAGNWDPISDSRPKTPKLHARRNLIADRFTQKQYPGDNFNDIEVPTRDIGLSPRSMPRFSIPHKREVLIFRSVGRDSSQESYSSALIDKLSFRGAVAVSKTVQSNCASIDKILSNGSSCDESQASISSRTGSKKSTPTSTRSPLFSNFTRTYGTVMTSDKSIQPTLRSNKSTTASKQTSPMASINFEKKQSKLAEQSRLDWNRENFIRLIYSEDSTDDSETALCLYANKSSKNSSQQSTANSWGVIGKTSDSAVPVADKLSSIASLERHTIGNDLLVNVNKDDPNYEVEMDAFVAKPKISRTPPSTALSVLDRMNARTRTNVRRISTK